jgi:hypothetical protein
MSSLADFKITLMNVALHQRNVEMKGVRLM